MTPLPDWLQPTFTLLPITLWLFVGAGLPWALAILPRPDWRSHTTVIAVAMALGPALTTTALFLVGTFGTFSKSAALLSIGSVTAVGMMLFIWQWRRTSPSAPKALAAAPRRQRWSWLTGLLGFLLVISVILRVWNTAYWPFNTYDELWVYGYNTRLFMQQGHIPTTLGYYPQHVPLAYTFMQLWWGDINDHAARTVVPMFGAASILMAYVLGHRLFELETQPAQSAKQSLFVAHNVPYQPQLTDESDSRRSPELSGSDKVHYPSQSASHLRRRSKADLLGSDNERYPAQSEIGTGEAEPPLRDIAHYRKLSVLPLVNAQRIGLLTAFIWAFYPHHGVWSQFGDLEVPITLYFTSTALFFILAWRDHQPRYILLSGLMLGAALWTKPTAAALIESLFLIFGIGAWQWWRSKVKASSTGTSQQLVRYALGALLVGAPMGGMWYIRNLAYGLPPLVLPQGYWQAEAQRSGQELGWWWLIGLTLAIWLMLRNQRRRWALLGLILLTLGVIPSAFGWRMPTGQDLATLIVGAIPTTYRPSPLGVLEYAALISGITVLGWAALPLWRQITDRLRAVLLLLGAFILPYFVTWFWSYSYHFRLSFAIVPLLIVVWVALLNQGLTLISGRLHCRAWLLHLAAAVIIIALAAPGAVATLSGLRFAVQGLLPDDEAKYRDGNPALMQLVYFLRQRETDLGRPLRIIAPNELRLKFFFPQSDIRDDIYPVWLDEIAKVDYFIDSSAGERLYIWKGQYINQIYQSRTRANALQRDFTIDDGNFRFSAYAPRNALRFTPPADVTNKLEYQFGDFAMLDTYALSTLALRQGGAYFITLSFRALKPAEHDYSLFIHFWDVDNQRLAAQWGGQPMDGAFFVWQNVPGEHFNVAYPTHLWQTGEYIVDDRRLTIAMDAPTGRFELRMGLYDPVSGTRVPIYKDGKLMGDSILLNIFEVFPHE